MDKESPENLDEPSHSEGVKTISPTAVLQNVDLQNKQFTETTECEAAEVNSSNLKTSSLQHLEMPESIYQDFISHSVHHSMDQSSFSFNEELGTMKPDLQISDIMEEDSTRDIHLQCSTTIISEDEPVSDIFNNLTISNLTAESSCEQTEADKIQYLSSTNGNVLCTPFRQDGSVISDESSTCISRPLEEKKATCSSSTELAKDKSEICPYLTVTSSDVNVSQSETPSSISYLETSLASAEATICSGHESVYYIKWVMFGQSNVPIITQNENGPCPLLAIMNVLLLKEKVKLAPMLEMITSEQLMTYLGECIFENMPQNLSVTTQANYEQNMQDAMSVMYKLQTGLDVNVKFTGVGDFEYTPELIIFDLLEISLYHGWLVDPQDSDTVTAINQCSYNQLVEKIISLRQSEDEDSVRQALIAEQFLERTASQLTYHGLCELSSLVKEKELCIFFRNNHFSTLYKHNNELFLLMTDQGFLTESNVVWETLSNVDGDCHFTDATFRTYTKPVPSSSPIPDPSIPVGSPEQIDHDYQVALFLQEEDASLQKQTWGSGHQQEQTAYTHTDHEFALRLQEEENRKIAREQQRTTATAVLDPLMQQQSQSRVLSQGPASEGQRRRQDRGEHKEEKGCSVL